jgi:hypothetical protein
MPEQNKPPTYEEAQTQQSDEQEGKSQTENDTFKSDGDVRDELEQREQQPPEYDEL